MIRIRVLGLFSMGILLGLWSFPADGQTAQEAIQSSSPSSQSSDMRLSIAFPKDQFVSGKTPPLLSLTVTNISNEDIVFPMVQIYIVGPKGEPPTTLRQRQLTNRQHSGEPSILGGGFEPDISVGGSNTRQYDLSSLYDLSAPGKYIVYVLALDAFHANGWKGVWVRSPAETFVIEAQSQ